MKETALKGKERENKEEKRHKNRDLRSTINKEKRKAVMHITASHTTYC